MKINKITEQTNPKTKNIDQFSIIEILRCINDEDKLIAKKLKSTPKDFSFIDQIVRQIQKRDD